MNFTETEQEIVNLLSKDLRGRGTRQRQQEQIKRFKELKQILETRFNLKMTQEYLFYIMRFYASAGYHRTRQRLNSFLKRFGYNKERATTLKQYSAFRKLIRHKIIDYQKSNNNKEFWLSNFEGQQQVKDDIEVFSLDDGVSYIKVNSSRAYHLI